MTSKFMREERYIVFKTSDLGNSLKGDEIRRLAREYAEQRRLKGKKPLECVVVEKDWPEYEPTWQAIEARVTGAQPAPGVQDGWLSVPERLVDMFCGAADNLGDMPISEAWAERWSNEASDLLEKHNYFREHAAPKPDGWRLVPVEPTPDMLTAAILSSHAINVHRAEHCYRAMIGAAPKMEGE